MWNCTECMDDVNDSCLAIGEGTTEKIFRVPGSNLNPKAPKPS